MAEPGYVDRDISVRGLNLHYLEWGEPSAPPMVLLHGFGVSSHMFDELAERVQGRYRLLALDQRGHGDSEWAGEGDYSRVAFVEDVEAFRKALGLERFVLVGHSMGGLIAAAYAVQHPAQVSALVLVDSGPEAAEQGVENIRRFTSGPDHLSFDEFVERAHQFNPRRTLENIQDRMRHRLRPEEDGKWTWKFDARFRQEDSGIRTGRDGETNDDRWQLFRSIIVPTLLVRGAESDVLKQEVAERAVREMHRARLAVIGGAGHSVPGDNPDELTAALHSFLDEVAAGRFVPDGARQPPLEVLVDAHVEARRRPRTGSLLLLAGGIGALIAVVAVIAGIKRTRRPSRRKRLATLPQQLPELVGHVPAHVDLDLARRRAAELVDELETVGRRGVKTARRRIGDIDTAAARSTAEELAHSLGGSARRAPAVLRKGARRAKSVKKAKRRPSKRALVLPLMLLVLRGGKRKQGKPARWRP